MNYRKWLFAAQIHLFLFGAANMVANAQTPPIVWQTPDTLSNVYYSVKFTQDGSQLVAGGFERAGNTEGVLIKRFDAPTGLELATTNQIPSTTELERLRSPPTHSESSRRTTRRVALTKRPRNARAVFCNTTRSNSPGLRCRLSVISEISRWITRRMAN